MCALLLLLQAMGHRLNDMADAAALIADGGDLAARAQVEARGLLADLVEIDTTPAVGTRDAVAVLQEYFLEAGFAERDVCVLANPQAQDWPNLVVRLRGQGALPPLAYISHLDVVPANEDDWSVPPFALTQDDGWLYGRGVLDMKGEVANIAAAMARLLKEGFCPPGDIVAIFSPDEETRGRNGVVWLMEQHPELFDARMVLNPDVPVAVFRDGERAYYGVQTSEKLYATFELEATNPGGHSSEPRADNAIYSLAAGLNRLANHQFPVEITPTVRCYFAAQAQFASAAQQADMAAVGQGDVAAAERLSCRHTDNAQLRTTCVATMVSAGHAENALPQRATATIQCRLIPGDTVEHVAAELARVVDDPDLELRLRYADACAPESQVNDALLARFAEAVGSLWPDLPIVPVMDAGGTDSLYTRARGIPTYGAPSIFVDAEDIRAHGRDERIRADRFAEGTQLAYRIMKIFAQHG